MDEVSSTENLIKDNNVRSALKLQELVKTKIKKLDEIGTELFNEGHHDRDIDYLESELEELVRKSEQ